MRKTDAALPATAEDPRWRSVVGRDVSADGRFVYGVRTTGVYCRPSCPSRTAKPCNVSFYATCQAAEVAGYRPCRRCDPNAVRVRPASRRRGSGCF